MHLLALASALAHCTTWHWYCRSDSSTYWSWVISGRRRRAELLSATFYAQCIWCRRS